MMKIGRDFIIFYKIRFRKLQMIHQKPKINFVSTNFLVFDSDKSCFQQNYILKVMNSFLLPSCHLSLNSKTLGLQQALAQKKDQFKLCHVNQIRKRAKQKPQKLREKTQPSNQLSIEQYFSSRKILNSMLLTRKNKRSFVKTSIQTSVSPKNINEYHEDMHSRQAAYIKPCRIFSLSKQKLSTSCSYHQQFKENNLRQVDSPLKYIESLKKSTNEAKRGTVTLRMTIKRKRLTMNQVFEEKNRKKRDYQFAKIYRGDVIPEFITYSRKKNLSNQNRLIKNISLKRHSYFKIQSVSKQQMQE